MKAAKEISFKNPIIRVKIMDDSKLLLVDAKSIVRFLDINNLKTLSKFKCGVEYESFKRQVFDFSGDGLNFALINSTKKESLLCDANSKKIIAKVDRHSGEVNCVAIDPKSKYMFSCGDDGKSFAVDIKKRKIVFTLAMHSDSINDIAFSKNAQWIATASYDKKIHLFNMAAMTKKSRLIGHNAAVLKVCFLSKKRLLSVDKKNNAIVWDYKQAKVIARLEGIHDDVTAIASTEDGVFLFLGTELGYIIVYELESYKIVSKNYIKLTSTITTLNFDEKTLQLIVTTKKSELLFYDIFKSENQMIKLLKLKNYKKIEKIVEENPILFYTKVYKLYSSIWDMTLEKATLALQKSDIKSALLLFKNFEEIGAKNSIIKATIEKYEEFGRFAKFVEESKFPLAYALALKHPYYQESQIYKSLELKWEKALFRANKYATNPKGADLTLETLAPFRGVSQKTKTIQDLILKSEIYQHFYKAIGDKKYKKIFDLVAVNPFLKELPEYMSLIDYADSLYIKSHKLIEKNETQMAKEMLNILLDFTDFAQEAREILKTILD